MGMADSYYPNTYVEQDPASKQTLLQRYTPNLGQYLPDTLRNFLTQSLGAGAALGFRGPILTGRPAGLTMGDFRIAPQMEANAQALSNVRTAYGQGRTDPAIVGGAGDPSMGVQHLGRLARFSTPQPFRPPVDAALGESVANTDPAARSLGFFDREPATPYDLAVGRQQQRRDLIDAVRRNQVPTLQLIPGGWPPE